MRTYLDIVQRFVSEVGVAGGTGPVTIDAGRSIKGVDRVLHYVQDAHTTVCSMWPDWEFLWVMANGTFTATQVLNGDTLLPAPDPGAERYKTGMNMFQIRSNNSWRGVRFMNWDQFTATQRIGSDKSPMTPPSYWTVRPDRVIELSHPIESESDYRYQYYREPLTLVNDDDEILIPVGFERAVLCKAKMIFAERENAPEHMHGAAAEFDDLIQRLESRYLPGIRGGASHEEEDMVVRDV